MSEEQTAQATTDEQLLTAYASGMVAGIVTHQLLHDPDQRNDYDPLLDSAQRFVQRRVMTDPLIREDILQRLRTGTEGGALYRLGGAR